MLFKRKNQIENDILELYRKFNDLAGDIKLLEDQLDYLDEETIKDCDKCQKRIDLLELRLNEITNSYQKQEKHV